MLLNTRKLYLDNEKALPVGAALLAYSAVRFLNDN